ncbi:MAG: outer membrane protein assembly factor BamA, partial [Candidatus Aminicenantaceae bacterium]
LFLNAQEIIEKLEIIGNERVSRDTILYYISAREGDFYNESRLKNDFKVLWDTGFFSNIKIEGEDSPEGKIIKIFIEENPVIKEIEYKTGKKLKEKDILDKLKEKNEYVSVHSYYNPSKIHKIKSTIKGLLLEEGLHDGKIEVDVKEQRKNEVEIIFDIKEGTKTKISDIIFEGKSKLPDAYLKEAMKENMEHGLISLVLGKDVFKPNKLKEDLKNIENKFHKYGYMEAEVGDPRIEEITKRTIFLKKKTMKEVHIPVEAGYRYRIGSVQIEGNEVVSTKFLRSLIEFQKGDIYDTNITEQSIEDISNAYRDIGYIYAQVVPRENLDPKRKRVNLVYNIYEGEVAYVRRINFKGNTYTKDKVLRREMLLREGMRFHFSLFKNSLLRMNQLGLVELEGEPEVAPDPKEPSQVDITLNVNELQRNNIQFTAGYSGYEGLFAGVSYSTVNFLGAGEKLELMLQHGKRIKNYVFGFSEPYVFDLPINLGFNIYKRHLILPYLYERKGDGIDLKFGARLIGYWRTNLTYSFEDVNIILPGEDEEDEEDSGMTYSDPIYYSMFGLGNYKISSLTPMLYRSTIDSPLTPTKGTLYMASCKYAGSFLGGEIDLVKPQFEFTFYHPVVSNHVFGIHWEYRFIQPIGDSEIPFWERFYLGGERSIRGYDIYTIGPRSEQGTNIGGDKAFIFNVEYIIPAGGPLYFVFFYDRGNAYSLEEKVDFKNMYSSLGMEVRIFVPALRIPFRLIFSYNNPTIYASDSNFAFRFAIGTTF